MNWAALYLVKQAAGLRARWRAGGISEAASNRLQSQGILPSHNTIVSGIRRGNRNLERVMGLPPTPRGMAPNYASVNLGHSSRLTPTLSRMATTRDTAVNFFYDYLNDRVLRGVTQKMYPTIAALTHRHELDELRSMFHSAKARPGKTMLEEQFKQWSNANPAGAEAKHWGTFPLQQERGNLRGLNPNLVKAYETARAGEYPS